MKHSLLILAALFVAMSCSEKKQDADLDHYYDTVKKLSNDGFIVPANWKTYILGSGEFEIQLPPYMEDYSGLQVEGAPTQVYLFNYRDTTESEEPHYGRVSIDYIKDKNHGFNKATDCFSIKAQYDFWEPVVERALKGGNKYGIEVPNGKLLTGLHCTELRKIRSNVPTYIYYAYYRRGGHTKGAGPVSVHMFYTMNQQEAALITISFYDKDAELFKKLINAVNTFRWKEIYM